MSKDETSFDLVDRPWLLAQNRHGSVLELSLREVFQQANDLTGLVGEVPTQVFALTRLLLAILHRAVDGPRDLDHWEDLWSAPKLPDDAIITYLGQHRQRFDLLHHETPFLQVTGLHTQKGEMTELARLIADVPNGHPFFSLRLRPEKPMSFAEAARWLVHCHAFDPAGIKSGAVGDPRVKKGKGYSIGVGWCGLLGGVLPEGPSLRETLLLNLIARDYGDLARWANTDAPFWERDPVGAAEEQQGGRPHRGPVDLYTWQSRRIRLAYDHGAVTGVLICIGEPLKPQNRFRVEPHTAWRRSQAQEKKLGQALVYMPKEHDPSRAIWRGLASLLPGAIQAQGSEPAAVLPPVVLAWLGRISEDVIGADYPVRIRTLGMTYGSQSSTTEDITDDALSLRSVLLQQNANQLVGAAVSCVAAAEGAARALGSLAANLAEAANGDPDGPKSRATELAYAELDTEFRRWLGRLDASTDPTDAQVVWHVTARSTVSALAKDLLNSADPAAWVGRIVRKRLMTSSHAQKWFWQNLRTALPYAFINADDTTAQAAERSASEVPV